MYVASKIYTKCCYFEAIQSAIMTASEWLIEALYPMGNVYKKKSSYESCLYVSCLYKEEDWITESVLLASHITWQQATM